MRFAATLAAMMLCCSALASAADTPDAARQAATAYLDALARPPLAARAAAVKALKSRAQVAKRQAALRQTIISLIGGLPDRSAPLNAAVTGTHQADGFRFETVVFDSLPGYRVTAGLYLPEGQGPFPAILISPGHAPSGKASDYAFAANFARAGFVVLSYDIVGEGERLQYYDRDLDASRLERPTGEHSLAAYQLLLVGDPVVRYFINDALRGIDYLISRKEVDAGRIGAFGCSGGGAVTAYAAALDPRIKAAASACFVTTMTELLNTIGPQEGEQSTPGFTAAGIDLADWVELAAPRPYAIVSTTEDMFPFAGAREAYEEAKHVWSLYGAADKLHWITGPGRHGNLAPIASDIIGFFAGALTSGATKPAFIPLRPDRPEDILATPTGQLSTSIGSKTIQMLASERAKQIAAPPAGDGKNREALRSRLIRDIRTVTGASATADDPPPAAQIGKTEQRTGYRAQTIRLTPAKGLAFDGLLATPDAVPVGGMIYIARDPLDSTSRARWEHFVRRGWQVLVLNPVDGSGGDAKAAVLGDETLFALRAMLVNRTVTGMRIDQILEASNWLIRQRQQGDVLALYGVGGLGPAVLHAAALEARTGIVLVQDSLLSYRMAVDQPITRNLAEIALPGVLAKYDLPDLISAVDARFDIVAPVDAIGRPLRQQEFEKLIPGARPSDAAGGFFSGVKWHPYEPGEK